MSPWYERNQRALAMLESQPWARALVAQIGRLGITAEAEDYLFELRYGHDLARAGMQPIYEHPTGVGGSTVDFKLPSATPCLVELVSIRRSDATKAATHTDSEGGVTVSSMLLRSDVAFSDPSRVKESPQHELLRVVQKIEQKVYNKGLPTKFPVPDGSALHVILVDMRGFEGIGHPDRDHCRQIVGGPDLVKDPVFVAYHPETAQPIRGVWDPQNSSPGARLLRERVHAIGFVHEQLYCDDEITDVTLLFLNPAFFGPEDRLDGYPLRPATVGDLPARLGNSLWGKRVSRPSEP